MGAAKEIYPAKVYVVDVFDVHGVFDKRLKDPYPSNSYSYYNSIKEARDDIEYRKKRGYEFDKGDTFKITAIPFDEAYPHRYVHGGRRYNKDQVKKIMADQEEEAYWSDDGSYSGPRVTDEIEGRDLEHIFWKAVGGHGKRTREDYNRGYKAVKEYQEGIEDRKKMSSETKIKRALKKTDEKLKQIYGLDNVVQKAEKTLEKKTKKKTLDLKAKKMLTAAALRKKKPAGKPKRKVVKKRK